jgi:hypothetical protein
VDRQSRIHGATGLGRFMRRGGALRRGKLN